jgi:hypothetical protein
MIITETSRSTFEVTLLDKDNDIEFVMNDKQDYYAVEYLNIEETKKLIKFLLEQVDTFNNK